MNPHNTETASTFVARTLGLTLSGAPAKADHTCAMCSVAVPTGHNCVPFKPSPDFNDGRALATTRPEVICPACAALWDVPVMRHIQKCVVTENAVYPLKNFASLAWFLQSPPEPPFVVVYSDAKAVFATQHLVWRTPITRSKKLIYFRLGPKAVWPLRLEILHSAAKACRAITALPLQPSVNGKKPKKLKAPNHPFVRLDLGLADRDHGVMRSDYRTAAQAAGLHTELAVLDTLNNGELWALVALMQTKIAPAQPTPLKLPLNPSASADSAEPAAGVEDPSPEAEA